MIVEVTVIGIVLLGPFAMAVLSYAADWRGTGVIGVCEECGGEIRYDEIVRLGGPGAARESAYCSRACARGGTDGSVGGVSGGRR